MNSENLTSELIHKSYQVAYGSYSATDSPDDDDAATASASGSGPAEAAHVGAVAVVAGAVAVHALRQVALKLDLQF